MTIEKQTLYKKAYVELLQLINNLSIQEQNKIPSNFISYLEKNKDENYIFKINKNKGILEQEYMTETKALIVKLYEKFLAPTEEKELWEKYDKICFNKFEEEKRNKYTTDIFNYTEKTNNYTLPIIYQNESFFKQILKKITTFLKNKFRKDI